MTKSKTIKVTCHGSIPFGEQYNTPWEDIWLEWKGGGKRKYYLAAVVVGIYDLKRQIEMIEDILREHSEYDENTYEDYLPSKEALKRLEEGEEFHVWAHTHDKCEKKRKNKNVISGGCPCVFINKELFHKSDAEEACRIVIEHVFPQWKGKTKNWKFKWILPKTIINPA